MQGWEQFDEYVDWIVSIGAFGPFGYEHCDAFFTVAHRVFLVDGIMLLDASIGSHPKE
ncbi:class I SAM-dependent methyltransferase [Mycobacterium leprae]|uniref:class I SAM-dependent methyltransferase n=1 Tax=Mycobacterium leprae TaxID=1769 RepID=UPI0002F88113|nr:class I SAM-dependent methyltransferase [Mycobacterium leprae]